MKRDPFVTYEYEDAGLLPGIIASLFTGDHVYRDTESCDGKHEYKARIKNVVFLSSYQSF